ncbi:MAG: Hsp20/alpha crystallin family protein [Mycobacteriaceae bacterium]|uniref:Hsp20/alpha crystallin family protein n=1 Tax=Corynebacterium sp. TaxID=1720 RepID=UPI003F97E8E0
MTTFRFDPFTGLDSVAREVFGTPTRSPRFMPMDLTRKDDDYVLTTDLPGVDADSIDIDIDNGVLTISAERNTTQDPEDRKWIANERFTGSYRRQVTVSDSVDTEKVTADYTDGVLTVTLPVAEKAKSRKISVGRTETPQEITA